VQSTSGTCLIVPFKENERTKCEGEERRRGEEETIGVR